MFAVCCTEVSRLRKDIAFCKPFLTIPNVDTNYVRPANGLSRLYYDSDSDPKAYDRGGGRGLW